MERTPHCIPLSPANLFPSLSLARQTAFLLKSFLAGTFACYFTQDIQAPKGQLQTPHRGWDNSVLAITINKTFVPTPVMPLAYVLGPEAPAIFLSTFMNFTSFLG